jgi:hypothetical protein
MSDNCSAVDDASVSARELWIEYRFLVLLFWMFLINVFLEHVQKNALPRLAAYKKMEAEICEELGMRLLQLLVGPFTAITGIGFLLYSASTGCNANEIYAYWLGGMAVIMVDVHEFIRRWPLRPHLLAHHIMTIAIALGYVEFEVLPASDEKRFHWGTVLFLVNIGLNWTVDFFHFVFRTSESLTFIQKFRKVFLWHAPIRMATTILLLLASIQTAIWGAWFGFALSFLMAAAYAYNTHRVVMFVYRFDCERYFNSHQGKWFSEQELSREQSQILPGSKRESRSSSRASIRLIGDDEVPNVLPGLRGDKIIDHLRL